MQSTPDLEESPNWMQSRPEDFVLSVIVPGHAVVVMLHLIYGVSCPVHDIRGQPVLFCCRRQGYARLIVAWILGLGIVP